MKNYNFIAALTLLLIFGTVWMAYPQENKTDKKTLKESNKIEKGKEFLETGSLIEGRKFVLRIEQELSRMNIEVNPQMNYLSIDSLNCVYDTEHKYYVLLRLVEENPLKGTIDNWKLVKDEKRYSYHLQFKMVTRIGLFDVFMVIRSDRTASGSISLKENSYSFYGHVFTL